jgi:hypothetical protein
VSKYPFKTSLSKLKGVQDLAISRKAEFKYAKMNLLAQEYHPKAGRLCEFWTIIRKYLTKQKLSDRKKGWRYMYDIYNSKNLHIT